MAETAATMPANVPLVVKRPPPESPKTACASLVESQALVAGASNWVAMAVVLLAPTAIMIVAEGNPEELARAVALVPHLCTCGDVVV